MEGGEGGVRREWGGAAEEVVVGVDLVAQKEERRHAAPLGVRESAERLRRQTRTHAQSQPQPVTRTVASTCTWRPVTRTVASTSAFAFVFAVAAVRSLLRPFGGRRQGGEGAARQRVTGRQRRSVQRNRKYVLGRRTQTCACALNVALYVNKANTRTHTHIHTHIRT